MPSPVTAADLIASALQLIGVGAAGEPLSPEDANSAFNSLNDVLELLSLQNMAVYSGAVASFTIPPQATYTIGATGDLVTTRPVNFNDCGMLYQGERFPIQIIGQGQYDRIPIPGQTGIIPEVVLWVNDFPLGRLTFWPVPSQAITVVLSYDTILTQITNLATTVSLPMGYTTYLEAAIAIKEAPKHGKAIPQSVMDQAVNTLAMIKTANKVPVLAGFDGTLTRNRTVRWQRGY